MLRRLYQILAFLFVTISLQAQPKHEVRAAWVTTLFGLDWPSVEATSPFSMQYQQEELCRQLDELQKAGVNLVFFQTRLRSDVAYRSQIEPMSVVFTGRPGGDPGYDPLAFAISECHKRGMECHAWIVAIPAGNRAHQKELGSRALDKRHKDLVLYYKDRCYLNPGNPETKEYLAGIVKEVVSRYDVDGVQFDYLRYPEYASSLKDDAWYRRDGVGRSKSEWRRDNITEMVRYLYHTVKELKPWVTVSTCPLGKYRDLPRYSASGFNAYNAVYQDPKRWLREGIQDMLFPMMYYRGSYFYPFVLDWKEESYGRPIVPGLGIYFLHPSEGNWTLQDVRDQLAFCRGSGIDGIAYYRAKFLTDNTKGLKEEVVRYHATAPALLPPLTWIDSLPPSSPSSLQVQREGLATRLKWAPATDQGTDLPVVYNVYASDHWPVDVSDAANLAAVRVEDTEYVYNKGWNLPVKRYYAVTASDRCHNEGPALQMPQPRYSDSLGVVRLKPLVQTKKRKR